MKTNLLLIIISVFVLAISVRGLPGNATPEQLNTPLWIEAGPFELSPERGRYALTYSLAVNRTPYFSIPIAKFTIPDLGYLNGKYVSLFAPGVSYLVLPGFLLGSSLGNAQLGTFAIVSLFAVFNVLLVKALSVRFGAHPIAGVIAGLVFLFATPAYAYGVSLYQHHISTFLILSSLYLLVRWHNFISLFLVWLLCAASIPIDYPNLFLMAPIGLFALGRLASLKLDGSKVLFRIRPLYFLSMLGLALPLLFFLWFNRLSYNDPFQFSGTVPSVREIDASGLPTVPQDEKKLANYEKYLKPELQQKSSLNFFHARNLLTGLFTHLFSQDRSILVFAPVVFLGGVGMYIAAKSKSPFYPVLVGIILANLILYSLWGDPWGGWAFGSRYLIPSFAVSSIFLSLALTYYSRKLLFLVVFVVLSVYSLSVNSLGAITSSANPPQSQVLELERLSGRVQKYTYARNWDILKSNSSKSYFFRVWGYKYFTAQTFYTYISVGLISILLLLTFTLYLSGNSPVKNNHLTKP